MFNAHHSQEEHLHCKEDGRIRSDGLPSEESRTPYYFPKFRLTFSLSGLLLCGILFYKKLISPWLPPCCRFYPSCSAYAAEAIIIHGPFKGSWYAVLRILRCNPFCKGGFDPVPPKRSK